MLEYQKQECDLTLQEGLERYYKSFPESTEILEDSKETGTLLRDHDCTHVIFGLDISACLLYTSPSPRDGTKSRMPSAA